jgi:hypothetical protein
MKIQLLAAGIVAFSIAIAGHVQGKGKDGIGVGVMVGEPTGLSLKKWIEASHALDAGVAWSFSENASLHFHGDYLFHRFDILSIPELSGALPIHYGLGFRIKLKESNQGRGRNNDDAMIGVRIPVGVSYLLPDVPIDVFAEIVPVFDVAPKSEFSLNAAIGVRYYFGR